MQFRLIKAAQVIFYFLFLSALTGKLPAGEAKVDILVVDGATGMQVREAVVDIILDGEVIESLTTEADQATSVQLSTGETGVYGNGLFSPFSFKVVSTFPNPCQNNLSMDLQVASRQPQVDFTLYNILGQRIGAQSLSSFETGSYRLGMQTFALANGIYFLQMRSSDGQSHTVKFVKIGPSVRPAGHPDLKITMTATSAILQGSVQFNLQKAGGLEYTFKAYTTYDSQIQQDGEWVHAGGYAETVSNISEDLTLTLTLNRVPFAEAGHYMAPYAPTAPVVDGLANDAIWEDAPWGDVDQLWLGEMPDADDFSGRYKIVWTEEKLYYLIEIEDDSVSDQFADPANSYYKDDCCELFIDEDHSGGDHQNNYNAFAYHTSIYYDAMDLGSNGRAVNLKDNIEMLRTQEGHTSVWEFGISCYDDTFQFGGDNVPVELYAGKLIGYAIAYCDNDGTYDRQHFIGSIYIPGSNKNVAWQNASVFGTLELLESK